MKLALLISLLLFILFLSVAAEGVPDALNQKWFQKDEEGKYSTTQKIGLVILGVIVLGLMSLSAVVTVKSL